MQTVPIKDVPFSQTAQSVYQREDGWYYRRCGETTQVKITNMDGDWYDMDEPFLFDPEEKVKMFDVVIN